MTAAPAPTWQCACGWLGTPEQMKVHPETGARYCPSCGATGGLVGTAAPAPSGVAERLLASANAGLAELVQVTVRERDEARAEVARTMTALTGAFGRGVNCSIAVVQGCIAGWSERTSISGGEDRLGAAEIILERLNLLTGPSATPPAPAAAREADLLPGAALPDALAIFREGAAMAATVIDRLHHLQLMHRHRGLADEQRRLIVAKIQSLTPMTVEFTVEDPSAGSAQRTDG